MSIAEGVENDDILLQRESTYREIALKREYPELEIKSQPLYWDLRGLFGVRKERSGEIIRYGDKIVLEYSDEKNGEYLRLGLVNQFTNLIKFSAYGELHILYSVR